MNAKRTLRWGVVLFLLAALPGLTAVMAQGQEPAGKDATLVPEAVERGESAVTIPYTYDETEPNDAWQANGLYSDPAKAWQHEGIVRGGVIEDGDDEDFWHIKVASGFGIAQENYTPRTRTPVLFNIDAASFGSPLDPEICLWDDRYYLITCNDDMQGLANLDSLLYFNLEVDRSYYLSVTAADYEGGPNYRYQLLLSEPALISAAAANLGTGYVDGIAFKAGDVLAWSKFTVSGTEYTKWVMLLDLSDLNSNGNLHSLAAGWRNSDFLLVSFAGNVTLPGISGIVTPWEVVKFDPSQVGPSTGGRFERWFDGRNHGLTTAGEKIDAIDWPDWNGTTRLRVSTAGAASVPGPTGTALKLADEDVGLWSLDTGRWVRAFDGTTIPTKDHVYDWGLGRRDVVAYSVDECEHGSSEFSRNNVVLNGSGSVTVTGWDVDDWDWRSESIATNQKSIVAFSKNNGDEGNNYWSIYHAWEGPSLGWNYAIDAIDYASNRCNNYAGNQ